MQRPSYKKVIESVFEDEQALLKALVNLHSNEQIELDPMYSKGNFYKEIKRPKYRFDICPQRVDCKQADAQALPIETNLISCMILDPPFCFGIHGKVKENISAKRFGVLEDFRALERLYQGILKEAFRVLKRGGILIFKCQDYTDSRTTMTHCLVYNWAIQTGFYAKDLAIYVNKHRIYNPKLKQRHLRKVHSYFWVFKK